MTSIRTRFLAGLTAFSEAMMVSKPAQTSVTSLYDFSSPEARQLRYSMLWASFQSNSYREIQSWVTQMKKTYGLYSFIRDIYNPTARIVTFHRNYVHGGPLDHQAGDGEIIQSALPIVTSDDSLREAIAELWRLSKWDSQRLLAPFYGALFGDAFQSIKVTESAVRIKAVDPRDVVEFEKDDDGLIYYYLISRPKTTLDGKVYLYEERAELTARGVQYQTYVDGREDEKWTAPFPFIPLVHTLHKDVGEPYGWAETFEKLSTFRELDDIASKTSDQVRKLVDPVWFFTGVKKPKRTMGHDNTATNSLELADGTRDVGRRELSVVYAPNPQSKAVPLTTNLDLSAALSHVTSLQAELTRHYPELRVSAGIEKTSGDLSGRALIISRQEATDKVQTERTGYDQSLVTLHKMGLILGGIAKIDGFTQYAGKDLESSVLQHNIGNRPVFRMSEAEELEHDKQFWINAALAGRVGVSLSLYLQYKGWSDERITEVENTPEYQARMAMLQMAVAGPGQPSAPNTGLGEVSNKSLKLPDEAQTDPNVPMSDFQGADE